MAPQITKDYDPPTKTLNCELNQKQKTECLRLYDKHSTELRGLFLLRLIQGNMKGINTIRLQAKQLNIPCEGYQHVVCVISPGEGVFSTDADAVLCLVKEQICQLGNKYRGFIVCCRDYLCRLVIMISSEEDINEIWGFDSRLQQILENASARTGIEFAFGVGPKVDQIELLSESYSYAVAVLELGVHAKSENAVQSPKAQRNFSDSIHQQLLQMFRDGDINAIFETVNQHVESIKLDVPGRQVLVERFAVLYLQNITNECMRLGITLEKFECYIPAVVCLMQLDSIGSISALLQLTEQILKYISVHRTTEGNHLLNMAKDFILENLGNERLDLASVSDHVGLSRVYFCKLFHQMEGVSFSTYLKNMRIEKARQLLLTTNMKVYEVSNAVGFSHAKYFGHVFKEAVGQTPVEFQKGIQNDL